MRLSSLILAGSLFASADSVLGQAGTAPADPISGIWTGSMGPDQATQRPITATLKLDGKAAVSGTITGPPRPGDIKTGTFDPKTGGLKLQVVVRGDGTPVTFEGKVIDGTASGRVTFPDQSGTFTLTKGGAAPAAAGPQLRAEEAAAELKRSFAEVSGYVAKTADLVPADKYTYRPAPSVRTFGQLIGHIADSYNYYCARAAGRDTQWSDTIEKGIAGKAALTAKLKQAHDACTAEYGGVAKAGALIDNIGHTNLHYGNLITYVRMLGLVPPSS